MSDCPDILISLRPGYAKAILDGSKTVELRRRRVRVDVGTRVWLYSTAPTARIEGSALIQRVHVGDLCGIWSQYSRRIGVSRSEFDEYFRGCKNGCAILLVEVRPITPTVSLSALRKRIGSFHPPQFFKRLSANEVAALSAPSVAANH